VADPTAVRIGAPAELRGADAVAATFAGGAEAARLALVDGVPGAVWVRGGRPKVVFTFTTRDEKITGIALEADPDRLRDVDIVFLGAGGNER
jgi:RNA polymerase sigma-70 factor (ECF subfamily)